MSYHKNIVYRAGTIPYVVENGQIRMMFMRPSNPEFGGDSYQIAKGKIEQGETAYQGALREAKEELGLFVGNVSTIEEVGVFMGRTSIYVAKIKDANMFGLPDSETDDTRWMTEDEFLCEGRSLHRPVVQAAVRKIQTMEGLTPSL